MILSFPQHRSGMIFQLALVFLVVVLSLIVIGSRLGFFERLRERWRREIEDPESEETIRVVKSQVVHYAIGGVLFGALKVIWAWRHAPTGSTQKLVWDIVLLLAIAVGVWIVIGLVDKMINRSGSALPDYSTIDTGSERESYAED